MGTISIATTSAAPLRSASPSIRNQASVASSGKPPAMTTALPKSASTEMATTSAAPAIPGRARASETVRTTIHSSAPRFLAACSMLGLTPSSTPMMMSMASGKNATV